jgi:hypothetical protein
MDIKPTRISDNIKQFIGLFYFRHFMMWNDKNKTFGHSVDLMKKSPYYKDTVNFLSHHYTDLGYGYKSLIKEFDLPITYPVLRKLLGLVGIPVRQGMNVCTERLKKVRSQNVENEKNYFYKWPEKHPDLVRVFGRGVQGYYFNQSKQKYVWLRSSYEYIFAKFLDKNKFMWDVEYKTYEMNGKTYRPDFFIFENEKISSIVEIKSEYYLKYIRTTEEVVKEFFRNQNIEYSIVRDIRKFSEFSLKKEMRLWKTIRKTKGEINENSSKKNSQ